MTPALTRQEMQSSLDKARASLQAAMVTKNDLQSAMMQVKAGVSQEMKSLHSENQAVIQNGQARHDQISLRLTAIERNVQGMSHEIAKISDILSKLSSAMEGRSDASNSFYYQRI